jgi:hypothetical protein
MSNFDNAHNVVEYVSGSTKAYAGQRLAKVMFKAVKDSEGNLVKRSNLAVSLPLVASDDLHSRMIALLPHVRAMVEKVQDSIVRERVLAGSVLINGSELDLAACIEYMNSDAVGERLTKESIGIWFGESVADNLALAFSEKLGIGDNPTAEESAKVLAIVADYSAKLQMLAGGKTSFSPDVAMKISKALSIACPDDELAGKFMIRLGKMAVVEKADMLGL